MVEAMGAEFEIESKKGKGTSVRIRWAPGATACRMSEASD